MIVLGVLLAGYLLGSLPWSLWAGKTRGLDLREHGSGNLGATNVYRVLGWPMGITVLLLDIAKGAAAVAVANRFAPEGWEAALPALAGFAAVTGHMLSPFVRFRGGKGVATGLGMFVALAPVPGLLVFLVWLAVMLFGGWVSVASCVAAAVLPVMVWLLRADLGGKYPWVIAISSILCLLVLIRHRSNWDRLRRGAEQPIWDRRPETPAGGAEPLPGSDS